SSKPVREMKDRVAALDGPGKSARVEQVALDQLHRKPRDARAMPKVRGDDAQTRAAPGEHFDQARADETGRSGDERAIGGHRATAFILLLVFAGASSRSHGSASAWRPS